MIYNEKCINSMLFLSFFSLCFLTFSVFTFLFKKMTKQKYNTRSSTKNNKKAEQEQDYEILKKTTNKKKYKTKMLTNQQEDNDYKVIAEESFTIAIAEGSSTIAGGNNSNLKSFF